MIFDVRIFSLSIFIPAADYRRQDPFSALDAHVGESVFQNVLVNSPPGKTRILVTHALHFLPQTDYIYSLSEGRIVEEGTYANLMSRNGLFARFVDEFASKNEGESKEKDPEDMLKGKTDEDANADEKGDTAAKGKQLMQEEERNTGRVSWSVYRAFLKAANAQLLGPVLLFSLVLTQGTQIMSSYWYVIRLQSR